MSKKVISIVLSVAMVVAVLCVGFGAITASADTVTYYFLAPADYLLTNENVGFYYWQPQDNAPWPGEAMTAAPEVGERVYKCECGDMDVTGTIIFNAFVDAGNPADPALAAVAHQTVNINLEGYMKGESIMYETYDNFYGMIYVLSNDPADKSINEFSGAATTKGEWFSIDPASNMYYKNYLDANGEYWDKVGGKTAPIEGTTTGDDTTTSEPPVSGDKKYHKDDKVTVTFLFGGVDPAGTLTSFVDFNKDLLKYEGKEKLVTTTGTVLVNDDLKAEDGMENRLGIGCVFDPTGEEHTFAGDKVAMFNFTFTALADFNEEDLGIQRITTEITSIVDDDVADVFVNDDATKVVDEAYTEVKVAVDCGHEAPVSSSEVISSSEPEKPSSSEPEKPSSSEAEKPSSSSKVESATSSKNTSSKATDDNASSKATSSAKTGSTGTTTQNGGAIQTAGTFAVVSLVVILMAAAAVVLYTRKKTEE